MVKRISAIIERSRLCTMDVPSTACASMTPDSDGDAESGGERTVSSRTRPEPGVRRVPAMSTRLAALAGLAMGASTSGLRPRSRVRWGCVASAETSVRRAAGARRVR